jgi:hypothetical protein
VDRERRAGADETKRPEGEPLRVSVAHSKQAPQWVPPCISPVQRVG